MGLKGGIAICGADLPDALEDLQEEGGGGEEGRPARPAKRGEGAAKPADREKTA